MLFSNLMNRIRGSTHISFGWAISYVSLTGLCTYKRNILRMQQSHECVKVYE